MFAKFDIIDIFKICGYLGGEQRNLRDCEGNFLKCRKYLQLMVFQRLTQN